MQRIWSKLADKASDAGEFVESVTRNGIRFLRSTTGKIPLLTSTAADDLDRGLEVDETHYLLVPYRDNDCGYTLYTTRSLPPGTGPSNSLPKARVFHLHDHAGVDLLKDLLVESKKAETLAEQSSEPGSRDLADYLESFGDQIDKESFKITGGLLIIGGAVAVVNPVIGVGIAAKALLPSLGAKASKFGFNFAGQKLRDRADRKNRSKAEKAAKAEIKKLKPTVYLNPLLRQLEEALATPGESHDPLLLGGDLTREYPNTRYLRVSIQAILSVYEGVLENRKASAGLHDADFAWFDHLRDLQETLLETASQ